MIWVGNGWCIEFRQRMFFDFIRKNRKIFYDIIFPMKKEEILNKLKELKPIYQQEGLEIVGLFGSYAKDNETEYSDIDIAYKLNYEEFSKKYVGGFSKLVRIDSIKDELKSIFKKEIDFVPDSNKKILKDIIYV
ncbi:nucleotidyltransferase domain-containing protein [Aliarcobacter butzleri]|uniref:nucleotidyltransferase family protein n=1 Tax=Aliarcobacter butzleri TaxID=28197 RepID=UPI001EDBB2C8|nr:nucleotidyltransferase domain-containing protein [Aliarcobacter butzleri]MCG3706970.1 nucleotidyltransferase domain-containing protein [Aliarcobacter butzleri]MCT7585972.1 nucleotidyltransferase domain-containing protein [Aliarcobacter butzleri]MDN5061169.1 nucleotidyltransferase domain-containing protein [Aliarcobacter butzleri]